MTKQGEIECMVHPLIKEILEQQRLILEMHKELIRVLAHPPLLLKDKIEPILDKGGNSWT